jgi:hypothetical protein
MLNDELLALFMGRFVGYGNLHACVWFLGMEEGGGGRLEEVQARLDAWDEGGRQATTDLAQFHRKFGQGRWFESGAPTQSTWRQLIRATLAARDGSAPHLESVRHYQVASFGRTDGQLAALELMPLPCRSTDPRRWQYGHWSALPTLVSRAAYLQAHLHLRIQLFKGLLQSHNPAAVVCYGSKYQAHWEAVCGVKFGNGAFPRSAVTGPTLYMLLPHPASRPSNVIAQTWLAAGERLRAHPGCILGA